MTIAEARERIRRAKGAFYAANPDAASEALRLVRAEFSTGEDPYENRWADKVDGKRPFVRGNLRDSFTAEAQAKGFIVRSDHPGAKYHQSGTTRMVARMLVPTKNRFPEAWKTRILKVYCDALERALS